MSEPSITEFSEKNKLLKFTLSNVNVSYANAIRRTIISNIPCIVFDTLHDNNENITFEINNTRLNNEIIKQRLSCIPIYLKDLDMEIDDYVIEVDIVNETSSIIFVTSKDFKIKNIKTDKYLNESTRDKIFPANEITNMYIDLCRLRPKLDESLPGEQIKFTAKMKIASAKKNGAFNVAQTCSYGNTLDNFKIQEMRQKFIEELEKSELNSEDYKMQLADWDNLNAKRYFIPDSFDFKIESVGVYENREIVSIAISVLIKKLVEIREIYSKINGLITSSESTLNNGFEIKLENEDFTIGKILEYELYNNHYNGDKILSFCGFRKPHPHINESFIRLAFNSETEITEVNTLIIESASNAISLLKKLPDNFVSSGLPQSSLKPIGSANPLATKSSQIAPDPQPKKKTSLKLKTTIKPPI